jgi:hypothetical protein
MRLFLAGRLPSRARGRAKPPLAAAWAGADARCPDRLPRGRPGDNTRPGGYGRLYVAVVARHHRRWVDLDPIKAHEAS